MPRPLPAAARLRRLAALRSQFGAAAAAERLAHLAALAHARLDSPRRLLRLHELALFARAYPDDARVLAAAEALLAGFSERRDLARCRAALADSGIAGTDVLYPFFYPTARWLARRFPDRLTIDWVSHTKEDLAALDALLAAVLPSAEHAFVRERELPARRALARLAAAGRTDAGRLLDLVEAMPGDEFTREAVHERASPFYRLRPGAGTPARTTARLPGARVVFRSSPPARARPDLVAELDRPPKETREVRGTRADALVALAREAMVTRARDLDCFSHGDARDVRRVVDHDGLEFVAIGSRPTRRLLLAAAYGLLTVRNGVPVGYVQLDTWRTTTLVHFNTFETFRGADAAWVFARVLAVARHLFGAEAFAIEPYQLGRHNDEALDSGAWWFYAKLGFAPRDRRIAKLAEAERVRIRRDPQYRSPRETLQRLASGYLFWEPAGSPAEIPPHAAISEATAGAVAARGGDPARARQELAEEAARLCALPAPARLPAPVRFWLGAWAPMLLALPGFADWSEEERAGLGDLVRTKAGRRESDLLPLLAAHPRFGAAVAAFAECHGTAADLHPPRV